MGWMSELIRWIKELEEKIEPLCEKLQSYIQNALLETRSINEVKGLFRLRHVQTLTNRLKFGDSWPFTVSQYSIHRYFVFPTVKTTPNKIVISQDSLFVSELPGHLTHRCHKNGGYSILQRPGSAGRPIALNRCEIR